MQITGHKLSLTPFNLRIVHSGLHLQVSRIRRARTRLRYEIGVTDVGVDIVRRRTAVGAVLQVQGWEEAADDGEIGADDADGGFDVCP